MLHNPPNTGAKNSLLLNSVAYSQDKVLSGEQRFTAVRISVHGADIESCANGEGVGREK